MRQERKGKKLRYRKAAKREREDRTEPKGRKGGIRKKRRTEESKEERTKKEREGQKNRGIKKRVQDERGGDRYRGNLSRSKDIFGFTGLFSTPFGCNVGMKWSSANTRPVHYKHQYKKTGHIGRVNKTFTGITYLVMARGPDQPLFHVVHTFCFFLPRCSKFVNVRIVPMVAILNLFIPA